MTLKEQAAMQQALEALVYHTEQTRPIHSTNEAITALREALAEQQEPVAYVYEKHIDGFGTRKDVAFLKRVDVGTKLYATPVRTKDLTDVDLWKLWEKSDSNVDFARAVIAADRSKNK